MKRFKIFKMMILKTLKKLINKKKVKIKNLTIRFLRKVFKMKKKQLEKLTKMMKI